MSPRVNKTPQNKLDSVARSREKRNADPVKLAAHQQYMREYAKNNREKLNAQSSESYYKDPIKRFKYRLKRIGVEATPETLDYLINHGGLCDMCGKPPDGRGNELSIDHCHETGVFRGMLCNRCNKGIGLLMDDPELLRRAADYIEHYR